MSPEARVALCECCISIILIFCISSPVFGRSWKFQARYPRISKKLQSWGEQPLWAAFSIMAIGGSVIRIWLSRSISPDVVLSLIFFAPVALYFWRKAYVKAKAIRMLEREREINALMSHDRDVDTSPIDETLILDDSEPGHLPRV